MLSNFHERGDLQISNNLILHVLFYDHQRDRNQVDLRDVVQRQIQDRYVQRFLCSMGLLVTLRRR